MSSELQRLMPPLTGEIIDSRTPEQWAAVVRADLGQAVAGFIAAGQHLREAKGQMQLVHYEWERWLKQQVGISPSQASKLSAIAAHPTFQDHSKWNDLPLTWTTLYELSQLEQAYLDAAIIAGRVTSELDGKQARALVIEYKQLAAQVSFRLEHGDFRELAGIESGSIDAVITDPPYPAEHLPLYSDLAKHAATWLRPGGVCAVMSGQTHLPEVIQRLTEHLTYRWTLAYLTPGGQAVQVFPRKVNTFWKPILVLHNGDYVGGTEWLGDVARSDVNDNDKRFHGWGQSESGMADLVKRLSRPGQLVFDPFMGAGTTGVAALALGRSFLGCDVNADHVESARERLEQTVIERLGGATA